MLAESTVTPPSTLQRAWTPTALASLAATVSDVKILYEPMSSYLSLSTHAERILLLQDLKASISDRKEIFTAPFTAETVSANINLSGLHLSRMFEREPQRNPQPNRDRSLFLVFLYMLYENLTSKRTQDIKEIKNYAEDILTLSEQTLLSIFDFQGDVDARRTLDTSNIIWMMLNFIDMEKEKLRRQQIKSVSDPIVAPSLIEAAQSVSVIECPPSVATADPAAIRENTRIEDIPAGTLENAAAIVTPSIVDAAVNPAPVVACSVAIATTSDVVTIGRNNATSIQTTATTDSKSEMRVKEARNEGIAAQTSTETNRSSQAPRAFRISTRGDLLQMPPAVNPTSRKQKKRKTLKCTIL